MFEVADKRKNPCHDAPGQPRTLNFCITWHWPADPCGLGKRVVVMSQYMHSNLRRASYLLHVVTRCRWGETFSKDRPAQKAEFVSLPLVWWLMFHCKWWLKCSVNRLVINDANSLMQREKKEKITEKRKMLEFSRRKNTSWHALHCIFREKSVMQLSTVI